MKKIRTRKKNNKREAEDNVKADQDMAALIKHTEEETSAIKSKYYACS